MENEDPWVEKLAVSAMADPKYLAMVAHIELGTEVGEISKECELSNIQSSYKDLSTVTLKGGKTLILKHNSEIMVPKNERSNYIKNCSLFVHMNDSGTDRQTGTETRFSI